MYICLCVYTGVFVHVQVVYVCGVCVGMYMCVYMCAGVFVGVGVYIFVCVCVGSRTVLVADPDCPLISCFHGTCQPLQQQLE